MSYLNRQSEYQIAGSLAILLGIAIPIVFVSKSTAIILTAMLGLFGFLLSALFKEGAISIAFAVTGIGIMVAFIMEYSETRELIDLGIAVSGFLIFMCVAIAEAFIHAQEKRLSTVFLLEAAKTRGLADELPDAIKARFGLGIIEAPGTGKDMYKSFAASEGPIFEVER